MKSKYILSLLFLGLLLLQFTDADAQRRRGIRHRTASGKLWFGPIVGVNYANVMGDFAGDSDWKVGYHAGLLADIGITTDFVVEPTLLYSLKGVQSASESSVKLNLSYAEIQCNLKVKAGYYRTVNFFAGPFVAFLVSAKATNGEDKLDVKDQFNGIDFGINGGAGYQMKNGLGVTVRYELGIANINGDLPGQTVVPVSNTANAMLSFIYLLRKD
jgi:hypothetical protein